MKPQKLPYESISIERQSRWPSSIGFVIAMAIGFFAGGVATVIAIFSAAGGHGNYLAAKLLFPYTMLSTVAFGEITVVFSIVAVAQFPAYAALLALGIGKSQGVRSAVFIAVVHGAAIVLCFLVAMPNFS